MFGKKQSEAINLDRVDTIIGKDCELKGTLQASGVIRIDGRLQGDIIHSGDLVIGENALIIASIKARNVTVAGEVRGNIDAEGRLELVPTAKLYGDIRVGNLVIADGAVFRGSSEMKGVAETTAPRPVPPKPEPEPPMSLWNKED